MRRLCIHTAWAGVLALLPALAACAPLRVSFDIGFVREGVRETVVERDPGAGSAKVALIHVSGLLADADQPPGLFGGGSNPVDELVASLDRAAKDANVRAVLLRVNSPGGTVTASDIIYREIRRFRAKTGKPVVVSMGELAASGGYYISLAADRVLAEPTTTTGSIGVIFQTFNVSEALERFGVRARAITSGPNKDLASPFARERDAQYAILQANVDELYSRFRHLVLERRPNLPAERVDEATDGRIFTGAAAADLGLVDEVGGVRDAFDAAKSLAGLKSARLVMYHRAGDAPRSPYASSASAPPPPSAGAGRSGAGGVNLLQVNLSAARALGWIEPGFYYLWTPHGG